MNQQELEDYTKNLGIVVKELITNNSGGVDEPISQTLVDNIVATAMVDGSPLAFAGTDKVTNTLYFKSDTPIVLSDLSAVGAVVITPQQVGTLNYYAITLIMNNPDPTGLNETKDLILTIKNQSFGFTLHSYALGGGAYAWLTSNKFRYSDATTTNPLRTLTNNSIKMSTFPLIVRMLSDTTITSIEILKGTGLTPNVGAVIEVTPQNFHTKEWEVPIDIEGTHPYGELVQIRLGNDTKYITISGYIVDGGFVKNFYMVEYFGTTGEQL